MISPRQHGLLAAFCLLPALLSAQVQEGKELVMLDPKQLVHEIAINSTVATTITFPDKITLLTGFGLVQDPAAAKNMEQNRVALVHYDNVLADTLVVRLIKPGDPCHATVRTAQHMHLLRFVAAENANLAVIVSPPLEQNTAVQTTAEKVVQNRINYNTEELFGVLSKAKNRKALQPINPGLFTGWQERNNLDMSVTNAGLTATIYEIQRQPEKDATVFRCWISNAGNTAYEFEPNSVKIRVGERSYSAQVVDCADIVRPGEKAPMDIILQGGPGGGREGLSINQDFRIELPEPGRKNLLLPELVGDTEAGYNGK
jgi:hypothetical protein